jgi:hypothetical protein
MLRNNLTHAMSMSGATTKRTNTASRIPAEKVNIAASFAGAKGHPPDDIPLSVPRHATRLLS